MNQATTTSDLLRVYVKSDGLSVLRAAIAEMRRGEITQSGCHAKAQSRKEKKSQLDNIGDRTARTAHMRSTQFGVYFCGFA